MIMASWISTIDHPKNSFAANYSPLFLLPLSQLPSYFQQLEEIKWFLGRVLLEGYWLGPGLFPGGFATEEKGNPPSPTSKRPLILNS